MVTKKPSVFPLRGAENPFFCLSPDAMNKIEELRKSGLHFPNVDEMNDDSYHRHLVYPERKGARIKSERL